MKFFHDFNSTKIYKEYLFETFDDVLRLYPLEDIVTSPSDIVIASILENSKNIYYSQYANIKLASIPKNRNIDLFIKTIKNHTEGNQLINYNDNIGLVDDQIYFKISIINKTTNEINFKFEQTYESIDMTETKNVAYTLDDKTIKIITSKIPCVIEITYPEFILPGDYIEYKYKYFLPELPNIRGLAGDKVYLNITNSSLLLPNSIPQGSLAIALNSYGNILRGKTINDLYKFSKNSLFVVDTNTSIISIPNKSIIPINNILKIIDKQQIVISPTSFDADFSLIGIFLDKNLNLDYKVLLNKQYYNQIIQNMNGIVLDVEDAIQLGFAILNNIGSKIIQYDLFIMNIGSGGGSGGGNISKTKIESTDKEITIQFSNTPPIVQLYDSNTKEQIVPQTIRYATNQVYIKLTDSNINIPPYEIILL